MFGKIEFENFESTACMRSDGEILDELNAGLRVIRRTIADLQPEILSATATGVLASGQDEIQLEHRPLMIIEVSTPRLKAGACS